MSDRQPLAVRLGDVDPAWAGWEIVAAGVRRGTDRHAGLSADLSLKNGAVVFTDRAALNLATGRADWAAAATGTGRPPPDVLDAALLRLHEAGAELVRGREADPGAESTPYEETSAGLVWHKPTQSGTVRTLLTNFPARIVADVAEDDGAEVRRQFEMSATLDGRPHRFAVPAERFAAMHWPLEYLGAGAIVMPGLGAKEQARTAIQVLSAPVPRRVIYAHTGWREHDGRWAYLHAGGALGPDGALPAVAVTLPGALAGYALPTAPTGAGRVAAIRASLAILNVAPDRLTVPLLAAGYRAVLGVTDFGLFLAGPTGTFKSELAALIQQHFGAGLDARHLPGAWSSTDNALEGQAFVVKDALLTIDDFAPHGSPLDVQRWHQKADRIFRAQGNNAGRARMQADVRLRPTRPPRGLILATGEDVPRGQSVRARLMILELSPGEVALALLTACQRDAAAGAYAAALAGYAVWLAPRYGAVRDWLRATVGALREAAIGSAAHRRTPEIVAHLAAGWWAFLAYAAAAGAVTADERAALWARGWAALGEAAGGQVRHQASGEPAGRFLDLLRAALGSGAAHVADPDGEEPDEPGAWGWRRKVVGTGDNARQEWQPQGKRIGWREGDALYLDSDAAYAVAQGLGAATGDGLAVTAQTLRKRLNERGHLVSTDTARQTLTVRRQLAGQSRAVLHLSATLSPAENPTNPTNPTTGPACRDAPPALSGFPGAGDTEPDNEDRRQDGANDAHVGFVGFSGGGEGAAMRASPPVSGLPAAPAQNPTAPSTTGRERVTL